MDTIKIINFEKENPVASFPNFRSLSIKECELIRQRMSERLLGTSHNNGLELVTVLKDRGSHLLNADAYADSFSLKAIFEQCGIGSPEAVLVNWYRFDNIDELSFSDLSTFFDDIWYPASDYIDVFDRSFDWVISIGYSGEVSAISLL